MDIAIRQAKVFIVDDSAIIRERLVEMISNMPDAKVVGEAETAPDAINGIMKTHPDCVVLDMQLRNSNGLSVLREVHPQAPEIVFMVLTNHASGQYCQLCLSAGASHFFDKSSDIERIRDAIASMVDQSTTH